MKKPAMSSNQYSGSLFLEGNTYKYTMHLGARQNGESFVPAHSHAQYELHVVAQGAVGVSFGEGTQLRVQAGEAIVIHPNAYHLRKTDDGALKSYEMRIECPKGTAASPGLYTGLSCGAALIGWFEGLEAELSEEAFGSGSRIQALITLILTAVLRELLGQRTGPADRRKASVVRYEENIDSYLAWHYSEPIRAENLAGRLGITTRQLARIMQQHYGCTFRQRVLEVRMYNARQLLTETDLPIWQVAAACGFSEEGSFSTAFHKNMGCTPSQFRKQKRSKE